MMAAGPRRLAIRLLPPARRFRALVAPLARFIEGGARFGYAARGAVYVSVGVMALLAALRLSPHATGAIGAMRAWGAWPPGIALLWAAGLGLYAFAGWRALQALFDADRLGAKPAALAARVGYFARGLAMLLAGGLTLMAGWHARASEAYGVGGALEVLKAQRFGHPLLGVIALGLIAFGLFSFFKACLRRIGC